MCGHLCIDILRCLAQNDFITKNRVRAGRRFEGQPLACGGPLPVGSFVAPPAVAPVLQSATPVPPRSLPPARPPSLPSGWWPAGGRHNHTREIPHAHAHRTSGIWHWKDSFGCSNQDPHENQQSTQHRRLMRASDITRVLLSISHGICPRRCCCCCCGCC